MNVALFDVEQDYSNLLPLTFTRPVSEIRFGILTIREKWERFLKTSCACKTQTHLTHKYRTADNPKDLLLINASICPDTALVKAIRTLKQDEQLMQKDVLIAQYENVSKAKKKIEYTGELLKLSNVWDIFKKNDLAIVADFKLLTKNKKSAKISRTVTIIGDKDKIFFEKGAKAEACIFNTNSGPIYIGKESEVMEGSVVRGPFALCDHSALKLNTKIYGATTVGPHCKVGGEVNNSVIFGYSNKAHDGFLGNSVIGEWCNLGADTNNSNLKNNYGNVKLYSYKSKKQEDTGLQFCGLIMGDHSKSGINTMFNTGTVVGVAANIYGGGFPPTHIPSFSWGGADGFSVYKTDKLFETATKVFERRELKFDQIEKDLLNSLFKITEADRK